MTDIPVPNGICSSEANEGLLHFRTQQTQWNVKSVLTFVCPACNISFKIIFAAKTCKLNTEWVPYKDREIYLLGMDSWTL